MLSVRELRRGGAEVCRMHVKRVY